MSATPTAADRQRAQTVFDFAVTLDCSADEAIDLIAVALAEAREEGRRSVGLGDFVVDECDEEIRAPYDSGWLRCSRRHGHDGDHEESSSGFSWSTG